MNRPVVAFHFGLVQDVAVLRPLIRLAGRSPSLDVIFLVSPKFAELDEGGLWMGEIAHLAAELGISPLTYQSPFDCLRELGPGGGLIIAGSESDARAHAEAHTLFRAMPGRFRTVTLQHGFECVGFLHNARHDATAGKNVRFAADIAVGWFELSRLDSVSAAERSKIYVAGPPILIDPPAKKKGRSVQRPGLVCENLHSVRFVNGTLRQSFLEAFHEFAGRVAMVGQGLVLRPHPAGRFTDRKGVALPENVNVSRAPLYDLDLSEFGYIISAPSTILFDFALAGVPVATWVDPDGMVDSHNFDGLPKVATVDDWWRFSWAAQYDPKALLKTQDAFLSALPIPPKVPERYEQLLALA